MTDATLRFLMAIKYHHKGRKFLAPDSPILIELRENMEREHALATIRIEEMKRRRRKPVQLKLFTN
jgi:hypothetical protein